MTRPRPTCVVLDTNIIVQDWDLTSPSALVLEQVAKGDGVQVLVPEIVVDEVVRKWAERYKESLDTVRNFRRLDPELDAALAVPRSVEDATRRFVERFDEVLRRLDAEVLGYPEADHEDIARRALDRRKPFDAKGREGYRDVLVWETLLAYAEEQDTFDGPGRYVLLSQDRRAFTDGGEEVRLAKDLQDEVAKRLDPGSEVVVMTSIGAFNDKYVEPAREILVALEKRMEDGAYAAGVERLLREAPKALPDDFWLDGQQRFAFPVLEVDLTAVEPFERLVVADAWSIGDDRFVVRFAAATRCTFTVKVEPDDIAWVIDSGQGDLVSHDLGASTVVVGSPCRLVYDSIYVPEVDLDGFASVQLSTVDVRPAAQIPAPQGGWTERYDDLFL